MNCHFLSKMTIFFVKIIQDGKERYLKSFYKLCYNMWYNSQEMDFK